MRLSPDSVILTVARSRRTFLLLARWRVLSHNASRQQCIAYVYRSCKPSLCNLKLHKAVPICGTPWSHYNGISSRIDRNQSVDISLSAIRYDTIVSSYVEKVETLLAGGSKSDWRRGYFWSSSRRSSFPADLFSIHAPDGNGLLEELFAFAKRPRGFYPRRYMWIPDSTRNSALLIRAYAFNPKVLRFVLHQQVRSKFGERISIEQF